MPAMLPPRSDLSPNTCQTKTWIALGITREDAGAVYRKQLTAPIRKHETKDTKEEKSKSGSSWKATKKSHHPFQMLPQDTALQNWRGSKLRCTLYNPPVLYCCQSDKIRVWGKVFFRRSQWHTTILTLSTGQYSQRGWAHPGHASLSAVERAPWPLQLQQLQYHSHTTWAFVSSSLFLCPCPCECLWPWLRCRLDSGIVKELLFQLRG